MPNEYVYVMDETKGTIQTHVGPAVATLNPTETAVKYDPKEGRYKKCPQMEDAICRWPEAPEGSYLVLRNPSADERKLRPVSAERNTTVPELRHGCGVNLRGPCTFPLWPGQSAQMIPGHRLRSNQYLVVRVYNPEEAGRNWNQGFQDSEGGQETLKPNDFTDGELLIVRGSEVKFFIPPTGLEVVPKPGDGGYVRDAVTLERLEYCVLVNENGEKRFEQGPQVVFPKPTEEFVEVAGQRKFRAIELDDMWGLLVKVTEDYVETDGTERKQGDQIFFTGQAQRIYMPRREHALVNYGDDFIHYGVAIPEGSARYVLNKQTGEVRTVRGPCMLLPNPIAEVIVRRTLSDDQCDLMFPGNAEAKRVNREMRSVSGGGPISEQQLASPARLVAAAARGTAQDAFETVRRSSAPAKPRTVQIDDKFEGAVLVRVWPNFAVKVVDSQGRAEVIPGPATVILNYDQELQTMTLSTGKPKTTEKILRTVYVQVSNNQVGDIVEVQTADLVEVLFKISLRINFEGDPQKWFDVDNYVKFLCDRVRSMLKKMAKQHGIEEINARYVELVRDCILGKDKDENGERRGRTFRENGARITDVEVLDIQISNESISGLLVNAQQEAVSKAIELASAERQLEATRRMELITQQEMELRAQTEAKRRDIEKTDLAGRTDLLLAGIAAEQEKQKKQTELKLAAHQSTRALQDVALENDRLMHEFRRAQAEADERLKIETRRAEIEDRLRELQAEADATVKQAGSITPQLIAAMQHLGDSIQIAGLSEAMSPIAMIQQLMGNGEGGVKALASKLLKGTGLDAAVVRMASSRDDD